MSADQLFAAIQAGNAAEVERLLNADPALARASVRGTTMLMAAAFFKREDLVAMIAKAAAPLTIFEAAVAGDTERVHKLVNAAADAVHGYDTDGWTALHLSAAFGRVEATKVLLEAGADVNAWSKNAMVNQPLHACCAISRSKEIVALLLDHGAEINAKQHGGFTPLHEVADAGFTELVQYLLSRGADPNAKTDDGKTAQDLAKEKNRLEAAAALGR